MSNQISGEIQETVVSAMNLAQMGMGYVARIAAEKPYILAMGIGLVMLKGKNLKLGKNFNVKL